MKRRKVIKVLSNGETMRPIVLRGSFNPSKGKIKVAPTKIQALIRGMSYDDMIEASLLAANHMRGIAVGKVTSSSPKANEFLIEVKKQSAISKGLAQKTLSYLNRQIVKKNEVESKPSANTKRIYRELMQAED